MKSSKLPHISDLTKSIRYNTSDIRTLLPFQSRNLSANLLNILKKWGTQRFGMVYDGGLKMDRNDVKGGWCEDIDGQPHHLERSLEFGANILNYLDSISFPPDLCDGHQNIKIVTRCDITNYHFDKKHGFSTKTQSSSCFRSKQSIKKGCPKLIAYNIYKHSDRYVFLICSQQCPAQNFVALLNNFRTWNIRRLTADILFDQKLKSTCFDKIVLHLFSIARSFLCLKEEDYNLERSKLKKIIDQIDKQDFIFDPKLYLADEEIIIIYRYLITYQFQLNLHQMWPCLSHCVTEMLTQIPKNVNCSYHSILKHHGKINQATMIYIISYRSKLKLQYVNERDLQGCIYRLIDFLKEQNNFRQQETISAADELFMNSFAIFKKYQGKSNHQYKPNITVNKTIVIPSLTKSTEISCISHTLENYTGLLNQLQKEPTLLSPEEIDRILRIECQSFKQQNQNTNISNSNRKVLKVIGAIGYKMNAQDIFYLITKHHELTLVILQIFVQYDSYTLIIETGKMLALQTIPNIFQKYLKSIVQAHQDYIQECHLIQLLRQVMKIYSKNSNVYEPSYDQIPIPIILSLLENNNFHSQQYANFIIQALPCLFNSSISTLKVLSPLLHEFMMILKKNDHPQELIYSFIANLYFTIIMNPKEGQILSNSNYLPPLNVKNKKVNSLLQNGGFYGYGYEVKNILLPILLEFQDYEPIINLIYTDIKIQRYLYVSKFISFIRNAHYTSNCIEVGQYLKEHDQLNFHFQNPVSSTFLIANLQQFEFQVKNIVPDATIEYIFNRTSKSESGIFNHLTAYNPKLRIVGLDLSRAIASNITQTIDDLFDFNKAKKKTFVLDFSQCYDYIKLVKALKDKYFRYMKLNEDEKIYLEEIMQRICIKKNQINDYIAISRKCKRYNDEKQSYMY